MEMSLNKFISHAGICSRRKADVLIKSGKVFVNNQIVKEPFYKVESTDEVIVDGKLIKEEHKVYILLNKPKGYVTTVADEQGRKTVLDLIKGVSVRLYPVGRLDINTTGVLVLTNDGELTNRLSHPKYEVRKTYLITLDRLLIREDLLKIRNGVKLEDGLLKVDKIFLPTKSTIEVTLHSGRNRIIRRLFEHLGYKVTTLDRIGYAALSKGSLSIGKWRHLSKIEVSSLKCS